MSGPELDRHEHRHENDPTGNGMVNHGPEKTPRSDPDRPDGPGTRPDGLDGPDGTQDEGVSSEPDESLEPGPSPAPPRADGDGDGDGAEGGAEGSADRDADRAGRVGGLAEGSADRDRGSAGGDGGADGERAGGDGSVAHAGGKADADTELRAADAGPADPADPAGTLTDLFGGGRGTRGGSGDGPGSGDGFGSGNAPGNGYGFGDGPGDGFGPAGGPGFAGTGDELDEVTLRRMLHGAVGDLEPSDRTLEHLQRAVPARRARRRQAVVGAAAAALLIGTAVPAFVHVANSDGTSTAFPAIAGHGEQAHGGNGEEPGPQTPDGRSMEPTDHESRGGVGEPDPSGSPSSNRAEDPEGGGATGGASAPPHVDLASLPACDPGQLGVASAGAGSRGADGTVYGSFRIANVSGTDCTVSSNGTVSFTALGAADPLKINVVQHTAGDAAPGLPDPSQEPGTVLLKPSMAYEVQFAWVPADTCPTVPPSPTPTPSSDGTGGSTGDSSGQSGTDTQSLHQDGGTADGSIAVTHTPETGAPTAETKINNACAGTIYRTGVLPTS
ncbi:MULTISPECIES: hypothetical protein [Streptomyces]|uniref:hypothetical protein n=1 Tax=Streptomyces TaxID=1883 RepID=UPI000D51011E|nr:MULTISPECIES: hypothetical protein [Streptomyces]PVC66837.1 hypothetical protein DBP15_16870 [Streptomyces sp. CS065A]